MSLPPVWSRELREIIRKIVYGCGLNFLNARYLTKAAQNCIVRAYIFMSKRVKIYVTGVSGKRAKRTFSEL